MENNQNSMRRAEEAIKVIQDRAKRLKKIWSDGHVKMAVKYVNTIERSLWDLKRTIKDQLYDNIGNFQSPLEPDEKEK